MRYRISEVPITDTSHNRIWLSLQINISLDYSRFNMSREINDSTSALPFIDQSLHEVPVEINDPMRYRTRHS